MKATEESRRGFIRKIAVGTAGIASSAGIATAATAAVASAETTAGAIEAAYFRSSFGELWDRIADYTVQVAQAMPAEHYDFKPVPEVRSFKEEMLHIAGSDFWINNYLGEGKGTGHNYDAGGKSKADCVELMDASFKNMSVVIEGLSDDELHETVETFAGPMNRMSVLWFMRDHITHHRAKAVVALRLNGVTPPAYVGS